MHRDRELIAGYLRVDEAEMLCELLASVGIEAWVEGAIPAGLEPVIPCACGGSKLFVPTADALRARELIATSGVFRGGGPDAEIPEEEWAVPPAQEPRGMADEARGRRTFLFYPVLVLAAVVLATALRMLVG